MQPNQPSQTALLIARTTLFWSFDAEVAKLIPPGAADVSRWVVEATSPNPDAVIARMQRPIVRAASRLIERVLLPGITIHYLLRKKYIAEVAAEALARGVKQVAVIAAGFDSLTYQLHRQFPDVLFVEIDHPATQSVKRAVLESRGSIGPNLAFLAVDLSATPLATAMEAEPRWDPSVPTLWIAEGLLMYLDKSDVVNIMKTISRPGNSASEFVFTFMCTRGGHVAFRRRGWLISRLLRWGGEPFRWGIGADALPAFTEACGLRTLEIVEPEKLRRRYVQPSLESRLPPADGDTVCRSRVIESLSPKPPEKRGLGFMAGKMDVSGDIVHASPWLESGEPKRS
jgi:methyltransferase (TIGR00027 family)